MPMASLRGLYARVKDHMRRYKVLYTCLALFKHMLVAGPASAYRQARILLRQRLMRLVPWPNKQTVQEQQRARFDREIKFSVLVPLYNTPEKYLREMIESVQAQTYENWELCLADGSDGAHGDVESVCRYYARRDSRIRYQKLEKNQGISANTNACIDMATGDYLALLDHDDLLHPSALFYVMQAICDQDADFVYTDEAHFHVKPKDADCPNFKPDFCPDTLRSYNYICHLSVFSRELLERAGGGFRSEYDGSQDYDLILRLTEQARHIAHVPRILYLWRVHAASTASGIEAKPYTLDAARRALAAHLERVGLRGEVRDARIPSTYDIRYAIEGQPLVSIVIPTKDHADDLRRCLDSIRQKSTWPNWEIILVENNSTEPETFRYYDSLQADSRIRVVTYQGAFNYPAINNLGARAARGDYLLLLNNDTEVITPDWIERMLMFAQRKDVGAAGCMLYYPDDTVQHAGVILGIGGVAGHSHKYYRRGDPGFMSRMAIAQNLSAVTAACMLIRRDVWEQVGGLDERFAVAFNDVDLCMRICKAGWRIVWTPFAELYHYESKSRGAENTPEKVKRFNSEVDLFHELWDRELEAGDPCYNPNLSLEREDFSLR